MTRLRFATAILVVGALALDGCNNGSDEPCSGAVSTATQTGHTLNVHGVFIHGQPIIRLTRNNVDQEIAATTYDDEDATFDLTGIAAGTYTVHWLLSCLNNAGEVDVTDSAITQITITS